jgi:hypothetical protein
MLDKKKTLNAIFILFCIAIPFENTALSQIGGVFTACLAFVFLPLFCLYAVLSFKDTKKYEFVFLALFTLFFGYSLVVSLSYIGMDYAFILDRGMRFFLIDVALILVFLICMRYQWDVISRGVKVIFSVVLLSYVINIGARDFINSASFFNHSSALSPHRMRGFTLEASTFGFQVIVSSLMLAIVASRWRKVIFSMLLFALLFISSKGAMLGLIAACMLAWFLLYPVKLPIKLLIGGVGFFVLGFILPVVFDAMFGVDVEKYNSVATRSAAVLTSLFSLMNYPFGAGFFGFLPSFYANGFEAISFMDRLFPNQLQFSEFVLYLKFGTVVGVSTKSFFFDGVIFGGLIFVFLYFYIFILLIRKCIFLKDFFMLTLVIYLLIASMGYLTFETRYIAFFAFAFLLKSISFLESEKRLDNDYV